MIRISAAALVLALALMAALGPQRDVQAQTPEIKPLISGFEPSRGVTAGGTTITISGSDFKPGATVAIAGIPATNVNVLNPSTITAVTAPSSPAVGTVAVTNPDLKVGISSGLFTYQVTVESTTIPLIQSVSPSAGSFEGGDVITITGSRFVQGVTASFGARLATNVRFIHGGLITVTTPPGSVGLAPISVTNPNGESGSAPAYSFVYTNERAANPIAAATATATATPAPSAAIAPVIKLPVVGIGLMVFSGGNNAELLRVSGCPRATAVFWASDGLGGFVTYVPGTSIAAVNAAWSTMFPVGAPAQTPLIARCA